MSDLLDALLLGRTPTSLRKDGLIYIPRQIGTYPETLDVDASGYPSEAAVEACQMVGSRDIQRWMLYVFPLLAKSIPYAGVQTRTVDDEVDGESLEITFATGGWSGCEDFIHAVLRNFFIKSFFLKEQRRGGGYTFVVPIKPMGTS